MFQNLILILRKNGKPSFVGLAHANDCDTNSMERNLKLANPFIYMTQAGAILAKPLILKQILTKNI